MSREQPHDPESDIICQYCGHPEFRLHGVQQRNRMSLVCVNCRAQVASIIDWTFSDERKERPHDDERTYT